MNPSPPDAPTKVSVRRYVAHLIDLVVDAAAFAVPALLFAERSTIDDAPAEVAAAFPQDFQRVDTFPVGADRAFRIDDQILVFEEQQLLIAGIIAAVVALFFLVIVQGRAGWTIGKAITGIRTVNSDGERPGILRALVRTILFVVDNIPSAILPIVGGVAIAATSGNRRLGDWVAGTYVVRRSAVGQDPLTGDGEVDTSGWETLDEHPGHVTTLSQGEPLRVGDAALDREVSAPTSARAGTAGAAPERGEGGKAPAYQPQWDPARQAYLQWDPRKEQWLQFDDDAQEWRAI